MGKQMLYIRKDIEPLFKVEKNKSKLVSDLLANHYASAPIGGVEKSDVIAEGELVPAPVTKRDEILLPTPSIDGRMEETGLPTVDGNLSEPGGDQTDGAKWN